LKVIIFIFIVVQSINIKDIVICGTKIIIFIIIESIILKNIIICGQQGNLGVRSRHVTCRFDCTPWARQPKRQESPRGGAGMAHARARASQPQRHVALGPDLAQWQVSLYARCPHMGARAWQTPGAAPPKLEVTIFSPTIHSMLNAIPVKKTTPPLPRCPYNSLWQGLGCHYTALIHSALSLGKL
jgi:hypothetical protein